MSEQKKVMADETKIIYHIDDEETPYLVKISKGPNDVTLGDFKNILNRPSYKFFFKSMDDDFGYVCDCMYVGLFMNVGLSKMQIFSPRLTGLFVSQSCIVSTTNRLRNVCLLATRNVFITKR